MSYLVISNYPGGPMNTPGTLLAETPNPGGHPPIAIPEPRMAESFSRALGVNLHQQAISYNFNPDGSADVFVTTNPTQPSVGSGSIPNISKRLTAADVQNVFNNAVNQVQTNRTTSV